VQRVNAKLNKEMELKYGKMSDMQFSKGKKKMHLQQWIHLQSMLW
jgi:hypothetical protein